MKSFITSLKDTLALMEDRFGGDITFIKPIVEERLSNFEDSINWKLPAIFRYFYTEETNGIIIDNKQIYSLYDKEQKKTWVDNLSRMNSPNTSPWFKGRPHIFEDYLVIGNDINVIFCLSKKYQLDNPSLYICKNPNNSSGVDFEILNLDLESLIVEMAMQAFS